MGYIGQTITTVFPTSVSLDTVTTTNLTATNATASTSLKTPLVEFTDGDDAIAIADTGVVTMPNQPAFMAKPNSNQTNVGTNTVIEFANEIFDQNADFDNSTHTFTAPITGRYLICLNMRMDQVDRDMNYCRFKVETSNNTYDANIILSLIHI